MESKQLIKIYLSFQTSFTNVQVLIYHTQNNIFLITLKNSCYQEIVDTDLPIPLIPLNKEGTVWL